MKKFLSLRGPILFLIGGLLLCSCKAKVDTHPVGELVPETDQFWEVVPQGSVIERIGINFGFTEGPALHPKGYLAGIFRYIGEYHLQVDR